MPGYISYVAGNTVVAGERTWSFGGRLSTLFLSACFVLGFSTVFVALGASATATSRVLLLPGGRPFGSFVRGLAFGFGWTPCIGPLLGAILTVSALSSTASSGIALLSIYSVGLGVPFLLSALFTENLAKRLKAMRRTGWLLQVAAGSVMIVMGVAMITGTMSIFAFWLLEQFPILTTIG